MLSIIEAMSRQQRGTILLLVDVFLLPIAFLVALALQNETTIFFEDGWRALFLTSGLLAVAAIISLQIGIPKIRLNAIETDLLGKLGLFSVIVTLVGLLLERFAGLGLSAGTYVIFGLVFYLASAGCRMIMLQLLMFLKRRANPRRRVLIYGAGTTGMQLANALKTHETIDPVAFVDDNTMLHGLSISGLPVHPPTRISQLVENQKIERVLLAMPSVTKPKQTQIVRPLQKLGLEVQSLPSFAQLVGTEELVDQLAPMVATDILGSERALNSRTEKLGFYEDRNILVTGAGGSIGSELCRQIMQSLPKRLVMFELSELALYQVERELRPMANDLGIELIALLGSVRDQKLVSRVFADYEISVVLHAAAYKHVPMVERNPLVGLANNVLGTLSVARAARNANVDRFLLVSSDKAVRPTNVMGASKRLAEQIVQDIASRSVNGVFSMVRFGNVLGSSGSVIPLFQDQISRGGPVTLTDTEVTRYFMTIDEAVHLVLQAGSIAKGGEVFVLDMGEPIHIRDLAEKVIAASGYSIKNELNPEGDIEIKVTGLREGEKLHEELLIDEGVLTTSHKKIFSAREGVLSELGVAAMVKDLQDAIDVGSDDKALSVIERCVEGFSTRQTKQAKDEASV